MLKPIVPLAGEIPNEQTGVGSVGELSPQLTSVIDNNPATDVHMMNLAFMTHLPWGPENQLAPQGAAVTSRAIPAFSRMTAAARRQSIASVRCN